MNYFRYFFVLDEDVKLTSEIHSDMKKFIENALKHLNKYICIRKLRAELLGFDIDNLFLGIHQLLNQRPVNSVILRLGLPMHFRCPGLGCPLEELTKEQKLLKVDIIDKVRQEIALFPRLPFLEDKFKHYFT